MGAGRAGGGGRGHRLGDGEAAGSRVGWVAAAAAKAALGLPCRSPRPCAPGPAPPGGKDTGSQRGAAGRWRPGRPAAPRGRRPGPRLRSGLPAWPPASSPPRRPHRRSASLRLSRAPGPASRASQARPRQSRLRSGPGDDGGEGGDLAGRRPRPRRSHLDNQPTPRPSRRKPGGTRGGASRGGQWRGPLARSPAEARRSVRRRDQLGGELR